MAIKADLSSASVKVRVLQLKQKIRDRLTKWIWAGFIENGAMVVVFVFLQTLPALS